MSCRTCIRLRYILLGYASIRLGQCQEDVDEDLDDDFDDDDDDNDDDDDDDEDDVSSTLPPAPTSMPPPATVPSATSVVSTPSLPATTSVPPTAIATAPTAISSFSTSATLAPPNATVTAAEDTQSTPSSTVVASGGLTTGAKAGIAVGVIVVVLAVVGAWLLERHRRRTRRTKSESKSQDRDNSTHHEFKSPRRNLKRFRRTTIDDHYAADNKAAPTIAHASQEVYTHYCEKDGGTVVPGLTRNGTERYELDAAVPMNELEGDTDPKSPVGPAYQTNNTLSPVSPLPNGILSNDSAAGPV